MQLWRRIFAIVSALAAATLILPQSARAGDDADAALARYIEALAAEQDPRVADALSRIDGAGRRLLALRSYVRSRAHLADRWSWTSEQIAAYEGTAEHGELQQEIATGQRGVCAREPRITSCGSTRRCAASTSSSNTGTRTNR